jgi:hypothetical protein
VLVLQCGMLRLTAPATRCLLAVLLLLLVLL